MCNGYIKYHLQDALASVRAPREKWVDRDDDEKYLKTARLFRVRFKELSTIGDTSDGGVHRPAFSEAHLEARRWFLEQARQAGLETQIDGADNQWVYGLISISGGKNHDDLQRRYSSQYLEKR
jgi:hypothetical protein